ncbi:MAG: acyl-CoA dehydrogenase [Hydrocarboniphaga sp.]|uniref:acyl-CoA dehydrogenase family protein n=1 Tax=Hydrocarboniphaga sp. TaxID=2033016 RepID=UPI0026368D1D|nr:acyl-CoA dehydrogenase family protein [Hydrocarboniphaga sp.]MDB5969894.1 acyl-CoA dehydrogenase [Hydrocarboniphaga sp.]
MNVQDTPEEARFRVEVRSWLQATAPEFCKDLPADRSGIEYAARGQDWQRKKAAAGFAAICLPQTLGGRDASPMMEVIFAEEEARYPLPVGPLTSIGVGLAVPTILAHGTPEQIERFVKPTLLGELLWCQLFSEPAAGSDLAGLRARATRDGDDWIISGQKVWNSWAHVAHWGLLVARSDASVPKHKGLSYFLLDMRTPGVEVRPIRQISGESEFNEVFLNDVRIPDCCRIGQVGEGWKVTMTTLMNERVSVGGESGTLPDVRSVLGLLQTLEPELQAVYRMQLARLAAQEQGLKYFRFRLLTQISRGEMLSAVAGMGKLVYANLLQDLSSLALDIAGTAGLYPETASPAMAAELKKFHDGYFWGAALRIAGGADEILRNQIAERALGLPGDIRVDKEVAFSKLPSGR